jgi:hypothetical protein
MPVENTDYVFVDDPMDPLTSAIKLCTGIFTDVVYKYGKISLNPSDGFCNFGFVYHVLYNPKNLDKINLDSNSEFKNHIGDVLVDVLSQRQFKIGNHGK